MPHTERPEKYQKGPDVMSKLKRTQQRYRKANRDQTKLDAFGFGKQSKRLNVEGPLSDGQTQLAEYGSEAMDNTNEEVLVPIRQESVPVDLRMSSDGSETENQQLLASSDDIGHPSSDKLDEEQELREDQWEAELDDCVLHGGEIRSWEDLRAQIKADLKKKSKTLPLSRVNQLFIIRNFATLILKGYGRISASREIANQWHEGEGIHYARRVRALARHYQVFEQLPAEKHGGARMSRSLLLDERVRIAARSWLTSQPNGEVTPRRFQHALNDSIFSALFITLKKPLCERTARRWLLKLGWRLTELKKGVYMDGHERDDVVKYRNEIFLPLMEEYERRMRKFEGAELKEIPPALKDDEKEIIPQFHDESCFTANEYKAKAWLAAGQTILQKKGRGRLIHVSEFINPITGRLAVRDKGGNITDEARKIIYPGSGGDPWWDTNQLLEQVKHAVNVFERAHPKCVALFIFDQSSAHASLGPDSLKAFEMNKSDGGKQRVQRDTIIPQSNPIVEHRGKVQKMTLADGTQKGLERVLTERGFDVRGMRAKCSPVCPMENTNCCMARLLSKQEDFMNQVSMLETLIQKSGHECIFLPKFHCELNPIEMVCNFCLS